MKTAPTPAHTPTQDVVSKRDILTLRKEDFSAEGLALGLWDHLTEGLFPNTDQVDVFIVLRKASR